MQRVRRAADHRARRRPVLSRVPAARRRPARAVAPRPSPGRLDARRLGGADRRGQRLGRVRRDREPGAGAGRPDRPRARLRDVVRLDRDAQGDRGAASIVLDAGPAGPRRQRRGLLRRDRRRGLQRRVRRDRRGARAAGRRRIGRRCRRLGRRDERVRRRRRRPRRRAGSSLERRRAARSATASTRTTTRSTGSCRATPGPQGSAARRAGAGAEPTPTPIAVRRRHRRPRRAHADADADTDADARTDARRRRRPPRRPRLPTPDSDAHADVDVRARRRRQPDPEPSPTPTPADHRSPRLARCPTTPGDDRRRAHHRPRRPRERAGRRSSRTPPPGSPSTSTRRSSQRSRPEPASSSTGTLDDRFAQRTLRAAEADIAVIGEPGVPAAVSIATGDAVEPFEGRRDPGRQARSSAARTRWPTALAVSVDDGSGPVRIVVTPDALGGRALPSATLSRRRAARAARQHGHRRVGLSAVRDATRRTS